MIESRLTQTEADVRHLTTAFEEHTHVVGQQFQGVTEQFKNLNTRMDEKFDQLSKRGQITWPVIFACIMTLVAVAGVAGAIHMLSLNPIIGSTNQNREDQHRHEEKDGHSTMLVAAARDDERLKALKADHEETKSRMQQAITELDTKLQLEMRQVNALTEAKLAQLDTMLQREMRLLAGLPPTQENDALLQAIKALREEIKNGSKGPP